MHACVLNVKNPKRGAALPENKFKILIIPILIIVSVTVIDQLTKLWAISYLTEYGSIKVLGEFLQLTIVYNEGGALGTNFGPSIYYLIVSLLILCLILYYLYSHRTEKYIAFPLAFISGGAIGNITDRIRIGKVVDWIDVDFFNIDLFGYQLNRWWTFNIADAAISCSIIFILTTLVLSKFTHNNIERTVTDLTEKESTQNLQ